MANQMDWTIELAEQLDARLDGLRVGICCTVLRERTARRARGECHGQANHNELATAPGQG